MYVLEKKLGGEYFDLVIVEAKTGNKNYINWIHQQTVEVGSADIAAIYDNLALGV
jgi:hypothetical protein